MLYILIIIILGLVDQFTKYEIVKLSQGQVGYSIPVLKNFFHITYVENHGGIFGLFQGKINIKENNFQGLSNSSFFILI